MARYALLVAALIGFLAALAAAALLLPALTRLRDRYPETAAQGPAWQAKNRAVPTLGGVCVVVGTLAGVALAGLGVRTLEPLLTDLGQTGRGSLATTAALGFALIGLADDLCRMLRKNGRGLFWGLKLALQSVVITLFLLALWQSGGLSTALWLPGAGYLQLGSWYYPFSFGLMLWLVNASDQLADTDGLCSCVYSVMMAGFIAVFGTMDLFRLTITPAAAAGALLAFVLYHFPPAKLRLGRVGSSFLGGMAAAWAWCIGWPGILPLLAAVVLAEGLSVPVQLLYTRLRGKPLLKMAPLHHHFLLGGWGDVKLCAVYGAAAAACMLLTLLFVRVSGF